MQNESSLYFHISHFHCRTSHLQPLQVRQVASQKETSKMRIWARGQNTSRTNTAAAAQVTITLTSKGNHYNEQHRLQPSHQTKSLKTVHVFLAALYLPLLTDCQIRRLLRLETLQTFNQSNVKIERQKEKRKKTEMHKYKDKKESSILWCQCSFAVLQCFLNITGSYEGTGGTAPSAGTF